MPRNISNTSPAQYKSNEDKITTALLQILHFGGHQLVQYIFEDCDLPSNDINVMPQVTGDGSRPDGEISCDCHYHLFIESKIHAGMMKNEHEKKQLEAHRKLLSKGADNFLIYLTPDEQRPSELNSFTDIIWMNWATVIERLDGYENSDRLLEFLINQFKLLSDSLMTGKRLSNTGLLLTQEAKAAKEQNVIIVGGAWGEDVALKYGFYACQPERFFAPARYITFCHNQRIENLFEIIGDPVESAILSSDNVSSDYFSDKEPYYDGLPRKLFKLKFERKFSPAIQNDKLDKNGKPCAFVQKQGYTTYDRIIKATKTSEL